MKPFKVVFISILLVLIYAPLATAAPSLLAMCHKDWNCKRTKQVWNGQDTMVFGWLENTFNEECQCADTLLQDKRKKVVRVHLINSPCMRNRRCGRYEVLYGLNAASATRRVLKNNPRFMKKFDDVLERAAKRIESSKGNLQCYISPCLECDLYEKARRVLLSRVSARLPNCVLVDNPLRGRCIKGTVCELHGVYPKLSRPCIADLDGVDGSVIDRKDWISRYRHCDISYYWEPWMNCIRGGFIDPKLRQCFYDVTTFRYIKGILCRYFYQSSDTCSR